MTPALTPDMKLGAQIDHPHTENYGNNGIGRYDHHDSKPVEYKQFIIFFVRVRTQNVNVKEEDTKK